MGVSLARLSPPYIPAQAPWPDIGLRATHLGEALAAARVGLDHAR